MQSGADLGELLPGNETELQYLTRVRWQSRLGLAELRDLRCCLAVVKCLQLYVPGVGENCARCLTRPRSRFVAGRPVLQLGGTHGR